MDLNNQPAWVGPYLQILDRNAFGNFRQLLYDITLNPGMGDYLNMKGNSRINPNENYAREIMQLFSIGVDLLNQDGTPVLDSQGNVEKRVVLPAGPAGRGNERLHSRPQLEACGWLKLTRTFSQVCVNSAMT